MLQDELMKILLVLLFVFLSAAFSNAADPPKFDAAAAERFAGLALSCLHREYPNKIAHVLNSTDDVKAPSELTPAFYGCYDWHSAVHGHWLLVRLTRMYQDASYAAAARAELAKSFTPANMDAEAKYLLAPGRETFERPYGLAWVLQLSAELREWNDPQAKQWSDSLKPLEAACIKRLKDWLPKLSYPIREGEHAQTAFAFGLILDWSRTTGDHEMENLLTSRINALYLKDRACPLNYEPSGQDFLSPCIAEADLMRRVMSPNEYAKWLTDFLPGIPKNGSGTWLAPGVVTDPSDGKLAHLDGLNLSRAWMLEGMASGLPTGDPRVAALRAAATIHSTSGLAAVTGEHYEGGHWLGSFAVYLVTKRGIPQK
jgi:hypothetical protein